ncbi:hypothetical protein TNCV_3543201 [Trichonephila clavipes]|nr:hypothetical protein TNCV_3543201 [Trichonephila clavipes]
MPIKLQYASLLKSINLKTVPRDYLFLFRPTTPVVVLSPREFLSLRSKTIPHVPPAKTTKTVFLSRPYTPGLSNHLRNTETPHRCGKVATPKEYTAKQ